MWGFLSIFPHGRRSVLPSFAAALELHSLGDGCASSCGSCSGVYAMIPSANAVTRPSAAIDANPAGVLGERMYLVVTGHVDHGKSTILGRLLADTGSLPEGKLEAVRTTCERNAKPFEYAFLLDALKDEQAQGITIDTARVFFKTARRNYVIVDAPGHIEFLKNMITGASRAEAALLVIDANEGVRENSRRHGFMLSMLGISQIAVLVNKMDLVGYRQDVFDRIVAEYTAFLGRFSVTPVWFIPVSGVTGENVVETGAESRMVPRPDRARRSRRVRESPSADRRCFSHACARRLQVHPAQRQPPHRGGHRGERPDCGRRRSHLLPLGQEEPRRQHRRVQPSTSHRSRRGRGGGVHAH